MSYFLDIGSITHRSPRTGRAAERAALTIYKALQARQDDFVQPGGGSADAPARTPRRSRTTSRKPAKSGDADGDGDEPAPARRIEPIFLDLDGVADAVALSTRGVQRLVQEGSFPKPRAVSGRRVAWLVEDVRAWARKTPVADMLPPVNAGMRQAI